MDLLYYKKSSVDYFFCIIIEVNQPSKNTTWNNGNNFSSLFSPYFSLLGCENIVWDWNWWLFFQVQELSLPLIASKCTPGAFHTLSISGAFFSRFLSGKTCRLLAAVLGPKKQRKISNFRHTVAFFCYFLKLIFSMKLPLLLARFWNRRIVCDIAKRSPKISLQMSTNLHETKSNIES